MENKKEVGYLCNKWAYIIFTIFLFFLPTTHHTIDFLLEAQGDEKMLLAEGKDDGRYAICQMMEEP